MKKLLLTLGVVGLGFVSKAQIIFQVEEPAAIADFYEFEAAGSGWGLASLDGVYVLDTVQLYDDGVSTGVNAQGNPVSANGCNAAPAGSLAGKIAVVFRGDGTNNANNGACEFGLKAMNAQNAGAVAVIIVNREEQVAGMAAGANGASVTIPVSCGRGDNSEKIAPSLLTKNSTPHSPAPPSAFVTAPAISCACFKCSGFIGIGCQLSW